MRQAAEAAAADGAVNIALGVPQTELFDLWQQHRAPILLWLKENPQQGNEVMEAAVRVLTFTGTRMREFDADGKATDAPEPRRWSSMTGLGCDGRLVPDTEMEGSAEAASGGSKAKATRAAREQELASLSFEDWLRRTHSERVNTEMNLQLGEFTLKKHAMAQLDAAVQTLPDFIDVFGIKTASNPVQCAEVRNSHTSTIK